MNGLKTGRMVSALNVPEKFQKRGSMQSLTHLTASNVPAKSSHLDTSTHQNLSTSQDGKVPLNRVVLFLCLAILGVLADLVTKSYVFHHHFEPENYPFSPQEPYWFVDGIFGIQCSMNPGALFGIGQGYSSVFAAISIVAIIGIVVWLFGFKQAWDRWLTTAFGLITGGILGNLYDRLGLGYLPVYPETVRDNVRDWILFRLEGVPFFDPWPNFNIADSLLVTGAIMLFVQTFFESSRARTNPVSADRQPAKADTSQE